MPVSMIFFIFSIHCLILNLVFTFKYKVSFDFECQNDIHGPKKKKKKKNLIDESLRKITPSPPYV